jgi:hypothetical protein
MKKSELKQIIKEEIKQYLNEDEEVSRGYSESNPYPKNSFDYWKREALNTLNSPNVRSKARTQAMKLKPDVYLEEIENRINMNIYDIKYDYAENWIIGLYDGKFDLDTLNKSIKNNYPSVKEYRVSNYQDSDGWNEGSFHVDILNKQD